LQAKFFFNGPGEHAREKGRGGAEKHKKLCMAAWHGKQEMPAARERLSRTRKLIDFDTPTSRAVGAVQSTLGVGGCGNIPSATCSLLFTKASAATLP
jgi:hypothetical protein